MKLQKRICWFLPIKLGRETHELEFYRDIFFNGMLFYKSLIPIGIARPTTHELELLVQLI